MSDTAKEKAPHWVGLDDEKTAEQRRSRHIRTALRLNYAAFLFSLLSLLLSLKAAGYLF